MPNDLEAWRKISQGEAETFETFYRENAPRLQAFLRQIVGNRQAAEDVAQETFTQLWTRPDGFDPERGNLRAYLFGIARKRAAGWWRKQKPSEQVSDDADTIRASETHALGSVVGDAFRRLPAEQRTLLWLREVEGHSYTELAAILEIPLGTVRSRLFAAREALRVIWQSKPQTKGRGAA